MMTLENALDVKKWVEVDVLMGFCRGHMDTLIEELPLMTHDEIRDKLRFIRKAMVRKSELKMQLH